MSSEGALLVPVVLLVASVCISAAATRAMVRRFVPENTRATWPVAFVTAIAISAVNVGVGIGIAAAGLPSILAMGVSFLVYAAGVAIGYGVDFLTAAWIGALLNLIVLLVALVLGLVMAVAYTIDPALPFFVLLGGGVLFGLHRWREKKLERLFAEVE